MDTHPRTRASGETTGHYPRPIRDGLSTDAQAACCFRYSASKRTPFFHTIKVIAAILRARVRRAIAGFIPLATKAAWKSWNGPGTAAARVAAPLKIFFRSWLWLALSPRMARNFLERLS